MGRRGLVLLLFGLTWIAQGASYFLLRDMFDGQPTYFLVDKLPLTVQGALWLLSGAVPFGAALRPRKENDTFGFLAVTAMPILLVVSYFLGAVKYAAVGNPLWMLAVLGVVAWAPIVLALAVVASWPEFPVLPSCEEDAGE